MKITNEKGVTLISLIATVVVLLVLLVLAELIIPDDIMQKADEAEQYTTILFYNAEDTVNDIKGSLPDINETE